MMSGVNPVPIPVTVALRAKLYSSKAIYWMTPCLFLSKFPDVSKCFQVSPSVSKCFQLCQINLVGLCRLWSLTASLILIWGLEGEGGCFSLHDWPTSWKRRSRSYIYILAVLDTVSPIRNMIVDLMYCVDYILPLYFWHYLLKRACCWSEAVYCDSFHFL